MAFLDDDLLERIHNRAPRYDAENAFPTEDFEELKAAGYYGAFVPKEYGGAGLTLPEIAAEQTRLAKAAPATALAINMHQIIVGMARWMVRRGDERGEMVLREAAEGKLYAFGISEPGNDLVLFGSITKAESDGEGGYLLTGLKVFTSMAPAWDQLMTFGAYTAEDGVTKDVFGVILREDGGFTMKNDWDVLGMRATQSNSTRLEGAHIRKDRVLGVVDPGASKEPVVYGIFSNFELLLGSTYLGIGERAIEVAAERVKTRRSVARADVYATDPDIRWRIADGALGLAAAGPFLRELEHDVENGVDGGDAEYPRFSAAKNAAAEAAIHAVDQAIRSMGGGSYSRKGEISRLYRDVLAGLFQPSDQESLHGSWASLILGPVSSYAHDAE